MPGRVSRSLEYLEKELAITASIRRGSTSKSDVRRVQEWLCLNNELVKVDGDFGPATETAVKKFQQRKQLPQSGIVTKPVFAKLTAPLLSLKNISPAPLKSVRPLALRIADRCLKLNAREAGGQNRGPWVRMFTYGYEGDTYPWCAGFVCWCLDYAAHLLGEESPLGEHTLSCDRIAKLASDDSFFIKSSEIISGENDKPRPGQIFLLTHTSRAKDWIHTGFVWRSRDEVFETVEGNTNDGGSREGYGVFRRTRPFSKRYDFALI